MVEQRKLLVQTLDATAQGQAVVAKEEENVAEK